MNRSVKTFLLILAIIAIAQSCKKSNSSTTPILPTSPSNKVKMEIDKYLSGSDTSIYGYDNQGRQISFAFRGMTTTYTYTTDTVFEIDNGMIKYVLNSYGYRIAGSDGSFYTYTTNWHPIIQSEFQDSTYTTWANGDANTLFNAEGGGSINIMYRYLSSLDKRDYGMAFCGVTSLHLVSTENITGNGQPTLRSHSYQLDTIGRVLVDSIYDNGVSSETDLFTYLH